MMNQKSPQKRTITLQEHTIVFWPKHSLLLNLIWTREYLQICQAEAQVDIPLKREKVQVSTFIHTSLVRNKEKMIGLINIRYVYKRLKLLAWIGICKRQYLRQHSWQHTCLYLNYTWIYPCLNPNGASSNSIINRQQRKRNQQNIRNPGFRQNCCRSWSAIQD